MFHVHGFIFALAMYFLPTIIACVRHLHSRGGIVMLNLFLGWTFIGWIAALIWAIAAPAPYYPYPPYPPYPPQYR
jgi:hypothetical protein